MDGSTQLVENVLIYLALGTLSILGLIGLIIKARAFFSGEQRDDRRDKYTEFLSTISMLSSKTEALQTEVDQLKEESAELKRVNEKMIKEIAMHADRANRYLTLLVSRCPYESLSNGQGYCDYWHPFDQSRIRDEILTRIQREIDNDKEESAVEDV